MSRYIIIIVLGVRLLYRRRAVVAGRSLIRLGRRRSSQARRSQPILFLPSMLQLLLLYNQTDIPVDIRI